jgi:hypothetical protein
VSNRSAYFWDQASITFGDSTVGRAEGIVFKVVGNWKPYLVPGMVQPAAIYEYGSWVTGRIRKAFLDPGFVSLFNGQFGSAGKYFNIVFTAKGKVNSKTDSQADIDGLTITQVKFDWELSLDLEDYTREDLEFIGKSVSSQ